MGKNKNEIYQRSSDGDPPKEAAAVSVNATELSDYELHEKIQRISATITTGVADKLPDKGEKIRSIHRQLNDEIDRRNLARIQKGVGECPRPTPKNEKSSGLSKEFVPNITSTESNPQGKLVDETNVAASAKLKPLNNSMCKSLRENVLYLQEERPPFKKSPQLVRVSSKELLSESHNKKDEHRPSENKVSDIGCSDISSSHVGENFSRRLSKRRRDSSQHGLTNGETEEVPHVVLLDDEDIQPMSQGGDPSDNWEEQTVFYPSRGDPECVELSYSDLKCLDPGSYLSSPIMNYYIQHLQRLPSLMVERREECHIFNTYFYSKLEEAMTCKDDRDTSFLKLRRWWKGIDIFQKAYIFLPIHGDIHWSLVIICIPAKEDETGLIILHLDSLRLHSSSQIFSIVASYLKEEWNYINQNAPPRELPLSGRIWKHLPRRIEKEKITVPQQKNEYDCGLFVLYFIQRFIEEAPRRLKKKDLSMFGKKWFRPEEASGLRKRIRDLLLKEFQCKTTNGIQ